MKKALLVRIDEPLHARVKVVAAQKRKTMADFVAEIIRKFFKES